MQLRFQRVFIIFVCTGLSIVPLTTISAATPTVQISSDLSDDGKFSVEDDLDTLDDFDPALLDQLSQQVTWSEWIKIRLTATAVIAGLLKDVAVDHVSRHKLIYGIAAAIVIGGASYATYKKFA